MLDKEMLPGGIVKIAMDDNVLLCRYPMASDDDVRTMSLEEYEKRKSEDEYFYLKIMPYNDYYFYFL